MKSRALRQLRICDLTGQLAGAGATRFLAAMGAQVIRIEDPVRQGKWDILRGGPPFVDERRGIELGGAFNNHNVEKLGVTINLRSEQGRDLFGKLVAVSDVVCENFSAEVMEKLGFSYQALCAIKPDIVYVSNCGFGHTGPYRKFRSWGSIVQACSALTFTAGLPGMPPAGWGYSYMDHHGANFQAIAVLAGIIRRRRTGEGMWIDMSCSEAGATLLGPVVLDHTANGRSLRREGMPHSNHNQTPAMAPHNVYPAVGDDNWIAIACRDDGDWQALARLVGEPWAADERFATRAGRLAAEKELDQAIAAWTGRRDRFETAEHLRAAGVPAAAVARPADRIDGDPDTAAWGLWPTVCHREIGEVRVDGIPLHFSATDWVIERGAPCLGQDNDEVFGEVLGLGAAEISALREEGVI